MYSGNSQYSSADETQTRRQTGELGDRSIPRALRWRPGQAGRRIAPDLLPEQIRQRIRRTRPNRSAESRHGQPSRTAADGRSRPCPPRNATSPDSATAGCVFEAGQRFVRRFRALLPLRLMRRRLGSRGSLLTLHRCRLSVDFDSPNQSENMPGTCSSASTETKRIAPFDSGTPYPLSAFDPSTSSLVPPSINGKYCCARSDPVEQQDVGPCYRHAQIFVPGKDTNLARRDQHRVSISTPVLS